MVRLLDIENYESQIKNDIKKYIKILEEKLDSKSIDDIELKLINLLNAIINSIQGKNRIHKIENLYKNLPIKRPDYIAVSLIYYLLNYGPNPNKIKITDYAELTNLARQNIRKTLKYLAGIIQNLPEYELSYTSRETYQFDEIKYISQINSYIKICINELKKNQKIKVNLSNSETNNIIRIVKDAIVNLKPKSRNSKIKTFYNSLDNRVKDPKYLAATLCYIYLRFFKDYYVKQKKFVHILNDLQNFELTFDSFSRTYSNFFKNHFKIDRETYKNKIVYYLDIYINRINSNKKIDLKLTPEFKHQAILFYDIATINGFDIVEFSKNTYSFTESKKYFPQSIAASLMYLALKKNREFENYATRDNMINFIGENLDYSRITSNRNALYNYLKEKIGRYKYQPYSNEDFITILRNYMGIYDKQKNPHLETVLLYNLFIYSKLTPSKFANKLNIHGGSTKDLLKIIYEKKFFTEFTVLQKIQKFINNFIPEDNKKKAIEAFNDYRKFWNQKTHIGKSEERCRKIFEDIFQVNFDKSYPRWLKSERGGQMHLDGYNNNLKIAFEYQGEQHYRFVPYWHRNSETFEQRQADDRWKKKLCKERDVILIEIPYTVKYNQLEEYIINKCKEMGIVISKNTLDIISHEYKTIISTNIPKKNNIREEKEKKKTNNVKNSGNSKEFSSGSSYNYSINYYSGLYKDDQNLANDYLWLCEKVREDIESRVEILLEEVREDARRKEDLLKVNNFQRYYNRTELEPHTIENQNLRRSIEESVEKPIEISSKQPNLLPEYQAFPVPIDQPNQLQNDQPFPMPDESNLQVPIKFIEFSFEKSKEELTNEPLNNPIDEPIIEPIENSIEPSSTKILNQPINQPSEGPIEGPNLESIEQPIEKSTEEPVEEPSADSIEQPIEKSTEEPLEEPSADSIEQPIEEPTEEPVEEPSADSIEQPMEEPAEESIEEPNTDSIKQPIEEPTEKSIEATNAESIEQLIEEPIEKPIEELNVESFEQQIQEITISYSNGSSVTFIGEPSGHPINGHKEKSINISTEEKGEKYIGYKTERFTREVIDAASLEPITDPDVLDDYEREETTEKLIDESPLDEYINDPIGESVEEPTEESIDDSKEESYEEPIDSHIERSADDHAEDPREDHLEGSTEDHLEESTEDHVDYHTGTHEEDPREDHEEDPREDHIEDPREDHIEDPGEDHEDETSDDQWDGEEPITESHSNYYYQFDFPHNEIDEKDFNGIEENLNVYDNDFDGIDKNLDEHSNDFDGIDENLDDNSNDFDGIDKISDNESKEDINTDYNSSESSGYSEG